MKKWIFGLATMLALCSGAARADAFDKGLAAYKTGNYAEASKIFDSLAANGSEAAQFNLGLMYYNGQGVPKDYKKAAKWYRMAADQVSGD